MARSVQIGLFLLCILVASCEKRNEGAGANGALPVEQEVGEASAIGPVSRLLFETETGVDFDAYKKISGSSQANCRQDGQSVKIDISADMYNEYALSVIGPDGFNLPVHHHVDEEFLAKNVDVKLTKHDASVVLYRNDSVNPCGDTEGGVCRPVTIWKSKGSYVFLLTKFLPGWYDDYDGVSKPDDYVVKAYCVVVLS